MNILVTGASGFIGGHLLRHLGETLKPGDSLHTAGRQDTATTKVKHHKIDLTQEEKVGELIETLRPQKLYHLVGISRINPNCGMDEYFQVNFLTTMNLLRGLEKHTVKTHLFFASSMHVYGNQAGIIDENAEARPLSHYAFTKMLAEEAIRSLTHKNENISAVIGRLYSCFGPGQPEGFVAADLCKKILALPNTEKAVLKVGPLASSRRFLDVRDVVQVITTLMDSKQRSRYEVFNIASPHELEIRQMVDILLRLSGKNPKIQSSDDSFNQFRGLKIKLDKLQSVIPKGVFRPVEETLKDMLAWR